MSTDLCSIKVANTAPSETMRADEIVIETAKIGRVTAVVVAMNIFSQKRCKLQDANRGNEKPSQPKAESANFLEENCRRPRNLSQKLRNDRIPKKVASKSKKLELNRTNLELNSKKTRSDHAKTPDPSVSSGLKVKK